MLLPTPTPFLLLHQCQLVKEEQQLLRLTQAHLPQRRCGRSIEIRLWGHAPQGAQGSLALRPLARVFSQVVVGMFEGDLHPRFRLGPVEVGQIPKACPGRHPCQQLLRRLGIAVGLAEVKRRPGQRQGLGVAAQPLGHLVGQVVRQAGGAPLQQGPGIFRCQYIQLVQGDRAILQRISHARVARRQEHGAAGGRSVAQRLCDGLTPHIVQHQQQPTVPGQQHLHHLHLEEDVIQPGGAHISPIGVGRQSLPQRHNLLALPHAGAYRQPDNAAGISRLVARGVESGQGGFAHAGQAAHPYQAGVVAALQALMQLLQVGGAPHRLSGPTGLGLAWLLPAQGQRAHIVNVEHAGVVANGAIAGRDHMVARPSFARQGLALQLHGRVRVVWLPVGGAARTAGALPPRPIPQRQPAFQLGCQTGVSVLPRRRYQLGRCFTPFQRQQQVGPLTQQMGRGRFIRLHEQDDRLLQGR